MSVLCVVEWLRSVLMLLLSCDLLLIVAVESQSCAENPQGVMGRARIVWFVSK